MSENNPNGYAPYGYDPQTGQPLSAPASAQQPRILGYDPQTGAPIYEQPQVQQPQQPASRVLGTMPRATEPVQPQAPQQPAAPQQPQAPVQPRIVGYDPQTGQPVYEGQQVQQPQAPVQPRIVGYDPQTGQPIYEGQQPPQQPPVYAPAGGGRPPKAPKAPKAPKSGKSKKGLIGGICGVAVLAIAAVALFVWPGFLTKRTNTGAASENPVVNSSRAFLSQGELGSYLLNKSSKNTGVGISISNIGSIISSFSGDSSMSFVSGSLDSRAAFSSDLTEGSASMNVSIMGVTVTMQMHYNEDSLTLKVPELLGDTAYAVSFKTAEQDLQNSIFAPGKSQYSLDQATYDELLNVIKQYGQMMDALKEATGGGNIIDDIDKKLEEQGLKPQFNSTNGSVTVNGESIDCEIRTLELGTEDLVKYVQFAQNYMNEYVQNLAQYMPSMGSYDPSDLAGSFNQIIDTIRNNHIAMNVEYDVYKNYAVRANLHLYDTTNAATNSADVTIEFGKDPAKSDHMTVTVNAPSANQNMVIEYRITTNTKEQYSATLSVTQNGSQMAAVTFDWNKSSGDFTLSVPAAMVTVTGNAKIDGEKLTLTLKNASAMGQSVDLSSVTITIDKDASIEKISGSVKNVLQLTEADIQSIMTQIQNSPLGMMLMSGGGF